MNKFIYSILISFCFVVSNSVAQLPIVETNFNWQNCLRASYYQGGFVSANNGYYLISGVNASDTMAQNYHGKGDIVLIHTDSLGNVLWKKCYGGSKLDWAWSMIPSSDGHMFLIGFTESDDGDIQSRQWDGTLFWVIKTDYNGDIIWEKTFGVEPGTGLDLRSALALPDGGNCCFIGYTRKKRGCEPVFWRHRHMDG